MGRIRISAEMAARHLFVAGLLIVPAFLLQDDVVLKAAQALLFYSLALLAGKRVRLLYFLLLSAFICLFELAVPWGRLLLMLGPLRITSGALERGAFKAATVCGLVFLSLATIRKDLVIPGRLGSVLGESFYYFEGLFEGRKRIERRRFFDSLDDLLFDRFDPSSSRSADDAAVADAGVRTTPAGFVMLGLLTALNWALLLIDLP